MSVADRAIPYAAIKSTADMKALLDMAEVEAKRAKAERRFETLIIDTLDAYQRMVIQEYLKSTKKASMSGWQDWGHLDAEMTELVARLSGIPMNIVVNLHVKDTKVGGADDGEGGILVKMPKLKGDLKDQIAAEFDLVGFMETGWEAIDGKRQLARYIQWEPTPDKPILKDRSGQLPKKTPVAFSDEDYNVLLRPLKLAQGKLIEGVVVAELAQEAPVEPTKVAKGGPVTGSVAKVATTTKAPAAKKTQPAVPTVTTPPPPVPVPIIEPHAVPVTEAEAVATVAEVLGGVVVPEGLPEEVIEEAVATPVVTEELAVEAASIPLAAAEVVVPAGNGNFTVACGQARYAGGTVPDGLNACGQALTLDMQEDRVTGCSSPEGQIPDLIQIAGLKTRAFLCNACFAAHRNSTKK